MRCRAQRKGKNLIILRMPKNHLVKIHESYRRVIAICDRELLGKKFSDGKFQLEVNNHFYSGEEMDAGEIRQLIKSLEKDYPSYNIVGKKSVDLCLKSNLISKEGVRKISGIPHAMVF